MLVKSSEDWSLVSALINSIKHEKQYITKESVLESIKNEIKLNIQYYKVWAEDETNLINELKQYNESGKCSQSLTNILLMALSNAYMLTILLLTSNDEQGYYFLAKEQDCIFPLRCKQYKMTVMINVGKDQYHALLHVQGISFHNSSSLKSFLHSKLLLRSLYQ